MLVLDDIQVGFPNRTILEGVSLRVDRKDRIALIGENGSGKSSLLRVAMGLLEPVQGSVERPGDLVLGYLPQTGLTHRGRSLWDEVITALPEWLERIRRRRVLLERLASLRPDDPRHARSLAEYGELETRFEQEDGYAQESKLKGILDGLGFRASDYERPVEEFSAGWQMRVGLAKLLAGEPDLMLLDEPTDHLDLEAKNWLESYLGGLDAGFVLVSHDRHFLDLLAKKVVEVVNKRLEVYDGNYSKYLIEKEKRETSRREAYLAQQEALGKVERFIARNRVRKDRARQVQSRIRMLEKVERLDPVRTGSQFRIYIPAPSRAPRIVLELDGIEKSYGEQVLFKGVDLQVEREERIGVVGPNGSGKSTFLRILEGRERVQHGYRLVDERISVGFFSQDARSGLAETDSVLEAVMGASPHLTKEQARGLLARFRFRGDDVFKGVRALSGGERARLSLACILPRRHHLLLLDEPTNHLDIVSRQALLEALLAYRGTLVFVSHDRYFIQEVATRILEIRDGEMRAFAGSYEDYWAERLAEGQPAQGAGAGRAAAGDLPTDERAREKEERIRQREARKADQRRIERRERIIQALEQEIAGLEDELEGLKEEMAGPACSNDYDLLQRKHDEAERVRRTLEERYGEWEAQMEAREGPGESEPA